MDIDAGQSVVAVFNCLQLLGLTLLLIVLVPALFSTRIHRMRTWHGMIISGIAYNLCYMPLMILGQQTGPPPSFAICLFQSCLIYCAPVLIMSFTLVFLVDLFLVFNRVMYGSALASSDWTYKILIGVPSIIYAGVFSATLWKGVQQRETIKRDDANLYCHSSASSPTIITATFVLLEAVTMTILEVYMVFMVWRTKRRLKSIGANSDLSATFPLSLFFRTLAFGVYVLFSIGITTASLFPSGANSPYWKLALTSPPIGMALTFGMQKDIIAFYWRSRRSGHVDEIAV
ncbi:hypothetical protein EDD18DRAFT_508735 [Armillaria luteobubalina]|uniref:Uncharacterized protein n=1 Tax=Armillaria luteobubalina TaxID=153913 RepID=A0AA39PY49_9AGAR|nr:hypothetical protein EDD18DRAFT_508735 [Armillaria luteobubalina]